MTEQFRHKGYLKDEGGKTVCAQQLGARASLIVIDSFSLDCVRHQPCFAPEAYRQATDFLDCILSLAQHLASCRISTN